MTTREVTGAPRFANCRAEMGEGALACNCGCSSLVAMVPDLQLMQPVKASTTGSKSINRRINTSRSESCQRQKRPFQSLNMPGKGFRPNPATVAHQILEEAASVPRWRLLVAKYFVPVVLSYHRCGHDHSPIVVVIHIHVLQQRARSVPSVGQLPIGKVSMGLAS